MKKKSLLFKILTGVIVVIMLFSVWIVWQLGENGVGPLRTLAVNRKPVQIAETMANYQEISFNTQVDNEKVGGFLYVPSKQSQYDKVVIISHGFNSPAETLTAKAKSFAAAGVPALVYDFRGGSTISVSDGQTQNMTISSEKKDLHAVINQIKATKGFEKASIYLMGESMGGLVTALVASERDDVSALMLSFPAFHAADTARSSYPTKADIPETTDAIGMTIGKGFWAELYDMNVYDLIDDYEKPVIIFYGTADPAVPKTAIEKANQVYKHSTLVIVEGAGHNFSGNNEKSVLKTSLEFINRH